jgi:hypothetical protein
MQTFQLTGIDPAPKPTANNKHGILNTKNIKIIIIIE